MFNILGRNVDNFLSLGYLRGYDPSINPYCRSLENLPRKITWTACCNPFYDFAMGFDKVKRMLNVFGVIFIIASYLLFSELWSQEFDKFMHALTTSTFMSQVLKS